MAIILRDAVSPEDYDTVRTLFREYQEWLGVDLCFQGFEQELSSLPGRYEPPAGRLRLAVTEEEDAAGCVALWALDDGTCEMKRLWVRPPWRGQGLGRRLAEDIMAAARSAGYRTLRLDSLGHLSAALALYRDLGFRNIGAYNESPLADVVYLERSLT